ncbi:hypothetical protein [Bacillus cereus]|uniref:hypothetical protein n=1 Tax=Bacillus cereus TaxID=1396 RepID=UPI0021B40BE6|nr:hypothetical protein [Bacillus cereus]
MKKFEGKFSGLLAGEENQNGTQLVSNWGDGLKVSGTSHKTKRNVKSCLYCNGMCDIVSDKKPFEKKVMKDDQVRKEWQAWYVCRECKEHQRHPYTD